MRPRARTRATVVQSRHCLKIAGERRANGQVRNPNTSEKMGIDKVVPCFARDRIKLSSPFSKSLRPTSPLLLHHHLLHHVAPQALRPSSSSSITPGPCPWSPCTARCTASQPGRLPPRTRTAPATPHAGLAARPSTACVGLCRAELLHQILRLAMLELILPHRRRGGHGTAHQEAAEKHAGHEDDGCDEDTVVSEVEEARAKGTSTLHCC
ncbi:hypothetical protein BC567DRAFT_238008 [Phyllosticta citribraziliensis]